MVCTCTQALFYLKLSFLTGTFWLELWLGVLDVANQMFQEFMLLLLTLFAGFTIRPNASTVIFLTHAFHSHCGFKDWFKLEKLLNMVWLCQAQYWYNFEFSRTFKLDLESQSYQTLNWHCFCFSGCLHRRKECPINCDSAPAKRL